MICETSEDRMMTTKLTDKLESLPPERQARVAARMDELTRLRGIFSTLYDEQKAAALNYDGPEIIGRADDLRDM